ncbi:transducin/WD40 repeat-like superfamily protein [Actinidia rufa]|uniref:Transducin/WD40 repeat-like superfamily protein n=1 Tax=Actinidia rufa TaxID=165716 RepID=A0A7J0DZS0_9ERIC|nr:transducin/WD40 repeat-like superfamily protein [Actinidia rufa]
MALDPKGSETEVQVLNYLVPIPFIRRSPMIAYGIVDDIQNPFPKNTVQPDFRAMRRFPLGQDVSLLKRDNAEDCWSALIWKRIKIRLYDQRLMQRGPIQMYEGNVNSHTRIQLGVDPCERIFMSGVLHANECFLLLPVIRNIAHVPILFTLGGEDCNLRTWDIKSGELLFEDKFMNSVPSIVCWPRGAASYRLPPPFICIFISLFPSTIMSKSTELPRVQDERQNHTDYGYGQDHRWGAWLGSHEGLLYTHWS